jgi:hypothetical protein
VKKRIDTGSEVLTVVVLKSFVLWNIMPCDLLKLNQNFREILVFLAISKIEYFPYCLRLFGFLLEVILNPEDGGTIFLQNVG